MKERTGKNAAPITGELDMHPVGTGVEAADGAVTGAALGAAIGGPIGAAVTQLSAVSRQPAVRMEWQKTMNPTTEEEKYWREYHAKQPYAEKGRPYEDYAGAYRTGYEGFHKYPGKLYEEIESDLALDYERNKAESALPWDHARHAVKAAWAKLSHDIGPRDPDRGIRSGF